MFLDSEKQFKSQWGGRAWFCTNSSSSGGVGIFIHNKINCKLIYVFTNKKESAIFVVLESSGVRLQIINLCGPPDHDDPAFFANIFYMTQCRNDEYVLFCGDWNMTMDPEIDTYTYAGRDRKSGSRQFVKEKVQN